MTESSRSEIESTCNTAGFGDGAGGSLTNSANPTGNSGATPSDSGGSADPASTGLLGLGSGGNNGGSGDLNNDNAGVMIGVDIALVVLLVGTGLVATGI